MKIHNIILCDNQEIIERIVNIFCAENLNYVILHEVENLKFYTSFQIKTEFVIIKNYQVQMYAPLLNRSQFQTVIRTHCHIPSIMKQRSTGRIVINVPG